MGFASSARAEVDPDLWSHRPDRFEQRIVCDVDLLGIGPNAYVKAGLVEFPLDEKTRCVSGAFRETGADNPRPAPFLAPSWKKRLLAMPRDQLGDKAASIECGIGNL